MSNNKIIKLPQVEGAKPHPWIGRIAIFELSTGTRRQGRILAINDPWIDTDNGAINVNSIVHAKQVSTEEARIIRGGPIGPLSLPGPSYDPNKRFG